jgi:hypothetical protein
MLTKERWNSIKWLVKHREAGAVFVGTEEECDEYISTHTPIRYSKQSLTTKSDFESYQERR